MIPSAISHHSLWSLTLKFKCLHWNSYRFFRQEVIREIRLAEKEHVCSEILHSNGNSNSIWKILNGCIPKNNARLAPVENPLFLANQFKEFYANVGKVTALKTANLAEEHNLNIQDTVGIHPCEAPGKNNDNLSIHHYGRCEQHY